MSKKIHAAFLLTLTVEAGNSTSLAFHPPHVLSSTSQAFRSTNNARSFPCRMSIEGNVQYERNETTAFRDVVVPSTFGVTANVDLDISGPTVSRYNNMMTTQYTSPGGETWNVSPGQTDSSAFTPQSKNEASPRQSTSTSSWKDRLIDISNIASFLCVLDCTLLPLISIALPALSWIASAMTVGANSNNQVFTGISSLLAHHLPSLGHAMALFFVVPIGILTTFVNFFFGHKQLKYTAAALFGLLLVYTTNSNAGIGIASIDSILNSWGGIASHPPPLLLDEGSTVAHVHDACGAIVGAATGMLAHTCGVAGEGWMHRLTNTIGCGFLLGSNYYGKKYMEKRSKGCAASVLAQAWGDGNDVGGKRPVCLPGCGCEVPSYGKSARIDGREQVGGEMFFSWDKAAGDKSGLEGSEPSGRSRFKRFRK